MAVFKGHSISKQKKVTGEALVTTDMVAFLGAMDFESGEIDTINISRMINLNEQKTFSALGWLARENKIQLRKKKQVGIK